MQVISIRLTKRTRVVAYDEPPLSTFFLFRTALLRRLCEYTGMLKSGLF